MSPAPSDEESVALLASRYPCQSETFVYREVGGLRRSGFRVTVVSLRPGDAGVADAGGDVPGADVLLYGGAGASTALSALAELLLHPLRGLSTIGKAIGDLAAPGEPVPILARLKLLPQALMAVGLARVLRRKRIRHVHCHFAHAPATLGMYAASHLRLPFSFVGHANDLFQRRVLLRRKLQRCSFVACISEWHRDLYGTVEPGVLSRCRVIRCGVDTSVWSPRAEGAADGRPLTLLTVGRLVEKKGIDTAIEALSALEGSWRLVIVGDGPLRAAWQALAERLGCSARVSWAGEENNEGVRRRMAEADLFVLPCRTDSAGDRDGIPVVLMEAMASGLPVVAGDLPAIRELVKDGETGRLVAGGDAGGLTRVLRELGGDPVQRRRLSEAGRRRVEEEFSLRENLGRLTGEIRRGKAS